MYKIPLTDIILGFSNAIDLVSPLVSNHQKRVAYIAYFISTEMGIDSEEKKHIITAGLLHDSGALHEQEKIKALQYDFGETLSERHAHGYKGWKLFSNSEDLKPAADIIKFHHIHWDERNSEHMMNYVLPVGSYILHLSDRIETLVDRNKEILKQRDQIINKIVKSTGMFMPDAVDAFLNISERDYFWFDLVSPYIEDLLKDFIKDEKREINLEKLASMVDILHQIIDFRSNFTAAHSIGVAECARTLALKMNFSKTDLKQMYIAGLLHDLGKLAVPAEILEKNGPLDEYEYNIIKKHTFYSYRIIERIPQMEKINRWASYHHERIDGSGYPFKLEGKALDAGSRIMAVSDVFTALTEHRPYRRALTVRETLTIMEKMAAERHIDGDILSVFRLYAHEINQKKTQAQNIALKKHTDFFQDVKPIR